MISSNLGNIFAYIKIERRLSIHKEAGYSKRGLSQKFITEDSKTSQKLLKKILEFLNIINDNFKNLYVIIRPHPTENPIEWKKFIGNRKNIEINGDGDLSDWITFSKCVVHGGCTSGIEADARNKIALDIKPKNLNHGAKIPTMVSQKIQTKNQIIKKISDIFYKKNYKPNNSKHKKFIKNRVINISNKPAYKVINETWENLGHKNLSQENSNLILRLNFFSKSLIKSMIGMKYKNHKFQKFSYDEIEQFKRRITKD